MRMLVRNLKQVQRNRWTPFPNWLSANQLPTRLANYRHLGFVSLFSRVYSNSAALYCQITPVDYQVSPILLHFDIHQSHLLEL